MKNDIFYTYIYLDPRKFGCYIYENYVFEAEPFYVGKGKNNQILSHLKEADSNVLLENTRNTYKTSKIRKILNKNLKPIIFKIKDYLTEQEAFDLEIDLIKNIGRADLNLGPLTNHTDGGDGISNKGPEALRKLSLAAKGKSPMKGKKHTLESRRKMSNSRMGIKYSAETLLKMSSSAMGEKNHFYGKIHTLESRQKMSLSLKGMTAWNKGNPKHSQPMYGKIHSHDTIKKMSESHKENKNGMFGRIPWNKGKTMPSPTLEQRRKNSESNKGKKDSEETKKLKSEAAKKAWIKIKLKRSCYEKITKEEDPEITGYKISSTQEYK